RGIRTLPATLREAMYSVEKDLEKEDSFLKVKLKDGSRVFSDTFLKTYIDYKYETEIIPIEGRPHPYEFVTTYSC
ncbi:MAG TPA: type I glutamate--ammonia ligase, partial [Nautiliaceae bacterium]|nr:type I glutamate--ammonia ligase [Nautiliaceae bacterium]